MTSSLFALILSIPFRDPPHSQREDKLRPEPRRRGFRKSLPGHSRLFDCGRTDNASSCQNTQRRHRGRRQGRLREGSDTSVELAAR